MFILYNLNILLKGLKAVAFSHPTEKNCSVNFLYFYFLAVIVSKRIRVVLSKEEGSCCTHLLLLRSVERLNYHSLFMKTVIDFLFFLSLFFYSLPFAWLCTPIPFVLNESRNQLCMILPAILEQAKLNTSLGYVCIEFE